MTQAPRPLRIGLQMDPITDVDVAADTSFRLGEEAEVRGHSLFYYPPDTLAFEEGTVTARGYPVTLSRDADGPAQLGEEEKLKLADLDVVLLRQDPPFDMHYITTTHLLNLVVNDPFWVRNAPEKLLVLEFPDLIPPTTIARDLPTLKAFKAAHEDIIVKPLYGNGGAGIFRLGPEDKNLDSLFELFSANSREPLIAQKFLPAVSDGDKRILLIDGEAVGAINRVPAKGEVRSNMHVGGKPEKSALTPREEEICATLGPLLREKGLTLVGIDVIGGYLTEINVTSPTGVQEVERFDGTNLAARFWKVVEARVAQA